jgi:chromosome segregation ATPase
MDASILSPTRFVQRRYSFSDVEEAHSPGASRSDLPADDSLAGSPDQSPQGLHVRIRQLESDNQEQAYRITELLIENETLRRTSARHHSSDQGGHPENMCVSEATVANTGESDANSDSDDEGRQRSFNIEEEFVEVCAENEDLREQIADLHGQLSRVMRAHVHSMTDELELVQAESQNLRQQSFVLEELREENARLRHRISFLETQMLDCQAQSSDGVSGALKRRGRELESIMQGIDRSHPDDKEQLEFFTDEMSERLTEVERRFSELSQSNERLLDFQAENAKLRSELAALAEEPSAGLCIETAEMMHERNTLEAEVAQLRAVKRELLERDELQLTIDSLTSERDELHRRVREQAVLLERIGPAIPQEESSTRKLVSAIGECLAVVKNSQLENSRANDEVRALRCQLRDLKEDKAALMERLDALESLLHADYE